MKIDITLAILVKHYKVHRADRVNTGDYHENTD